MHKYARICWNISNWRQPSGVARRREASTSYVAEHGFGHEEWLFNFEWMLSGYRREDPAMYRYGFLQPVNSGRKSLIGQIFQVLLYTIQPNGLRQMVARIDDLYVPDDKELRWAAAKARSNGWLALMREDLNAIDLSSAPLQSPKAADIVNVRFEQRKVQFFEPPEAIAEDHKIYQINRYKLLNASEDTRAAAERTSAQRRSRGPKSEDIQNRKPVASTIIDPVHNRLQNRLLEKLRSLHGEGVVEREENYVDLILNIGGQVTYIEIKTAPTAKLCIRLAVGQLLEYAHYPTHVKASKFLVVGDAIPSNEDASYLRYLRSSYKLPVYYAKWNWERETLDAEI